MGNTVSQIKGKMMRGSLPPLPQIMNGHDDAMSSCTAEEHELVIGGIARSAMNTSFPTCLVSLIREFSLCRIYSNILSSKEEKALIALLLDTIRKHEDHCEVNQIRTRLLFRASEHGFSADLFHKYCDRKGPTIVIAHNNYNHVYGGFSLQSWDKKLQTVTDPHTFVWCIRPKIDSFGFKTSEADGDQAMWNYTGYGPLYGRGNDLWITDKCDADGGQSGYGSGQSFDCKGKAFGASDEMLNGYEQCYCTVVEYEVFSVQLSINVPEISATPPRTGASLLAATERTQHYQY